MTEITFRSDMKVTLLEVAGSDLSIIQAMLASTADIESILADPDLGKPEARQGRIDFLMRNRHGSPFEHAMLKFAVEAPIAVFREWHRHRIGQSYNEQSGRYKELPPTFYVPPPERPLVQVGKPGAYTLVPGDPDMHSLVQYHMQEQFRSEYECYRMLLDAGVAKEVARGVLGVYLYSAMVVTMNPRSAMAFLSLRQAHESPEATFPSKPMWEINRCADQVEAALAEHFPMTHSAYVANGRVCP